MSPWIKICGITTPEAVWVAQAEGVDAIGFVFANSPRRVTPGHARRLAAGVRGRIACCAVVRGVTQADVDEIVKVLRPDVLQVDVGELASLTLPRSLDVLPVASARSPAPDILPERLLVERPPQDHDAGCDEAALRRLASRTRLILAGGLDVENVGGIVRSVSPFGVDVSRGVETAPGIKNHELIRRFVKAARSLNGAISL
jgi:phosphoribosylanthranilate isomerase